MMKKFLIIIILTVWNIAILQAQSWSIGGAAIYGDDIESTGVQLRGYYNLENEKICFGPEYSYFFKNTQTIGDTEISKTLHEFNFNIHYIIEINEKWGVYPLTGLNYSIEVEEETHEAETEKFNITEWGYNLGGGIHYPMGRLVIFGEYDHLFSKLSRFFFNLNKSSENKE